MLRTKVFCHTFTICNHVMPNLIPSLSYFFGYYICISLLFGHIYIVTLYVKVTCKVCDNYLYLSDFCFIMYVYLEKYDSQNIFYS